MFTYRLVFIDTYNHKKLINEVNRPKFLDTDSSLDVGITEIYYPMRFTQSILWTLDYIFTLVWYNNFPRIDIFKQNFYLSHLEIYLCKLRFLRTAICWWIASLHIIRWFAARWDIEILMISNIEILLIFGT